MFRRPVVLVILVALLVSAVASVSAAIGPKAGPASVDVMTIIQQQFPDVVNRKVTGFTPQIRTLEDSSQTVAFEVLPEKTDATQRFIVHHLAFFMIEKGKVTGAVILQRIPGNNVEVVTADLFSGEITRIKTDHEMPAAPVPPALPKTEDETGTAPTETPPDGCWSCVEWETYEGHLDESCMYWCGAACTLAPNRAAALACYLACGAACWVPGYTICVDWEWFNQCPV